MIVVVVKSNKGKEKLYVDGFGYHFHSKNEKQEFRWCCAERKSMMCKSVVITTRNSDEHAVKRAPTAHNHDPKAHCVSVVSANMNVKEMSSSTSLEPSQIIREAIVDCQPDQRVYLPSKRAQKIKINRNRKGTDMLPEPLDVAEICIPEHLKYLEGDLFVLSDWDFNGEKISSWAGWVMDGTFYIAPKVFRKLFASHDIIDGQFMPLVFCLMSKKCQQAYTEFFHQLFHLALARNINLNPQRIISDFEQTISSVAKSYFPDAQYKGCLFHFS